MPNEILWLAEQMTTYLRESYGLRYVNHDSMVALAGWMYGSDSPSDVGYAMLNKAAEELAEGVDPTSGIAVFAAPLEHHYPVPERVLAEITEGG